MKIVQDEVVQNWNIVDIWLGWNTPLYLRVKVLENSHGHRFG